MLNIGLPRRSLLTRGLPRQTLLRSRNPSYGGITVTRDGPDNWYVPKSAGDFTQLGLAIPDYLWLCQEASGDLAPTIGAITLTATATGHLYQQTVTGWTQKFVGTDGSTGTQSWRTTDAALDLSIGESYAMVGLAAFTVGATSKTLFAMSGGTEALNMTATTGYLRPIANSAAVDGTVAHTGITAVRQFCLYRRGDTSAQGAVSNLDASVNTYVGSARAGTIRALGSSTAAAPYAARYGWFAIYCGTNAEHDWAAYLTTLRGA